MRFEISNEEPAVADYYRKVFGILETDHKYLLEALNKMLPMDQLDIAKHIADDIFSAYKLNTPHEDIAKHLVDNLKVVTSVALDYAPIQDYSKAVFDLVRADARYREITNKSVLKNDIQLLDLSLALLTVTNFRDGKTPETTKDQFCSYLEEAMNRAEREMLMNLPIQGTH